MAQLVEKHTRIITDGGEEIKIVPLDGENTVIIYLGDETAQSAIALDKNSLHLVIKALRNAAKRGKGGY